MHSRGACRHGHRWTRRVGLTGWIKSLKGFGAGWIQQRGWSTTKTINPKKGSSLQNPPRQSTGAGGKQAHKHRDVEKCNLHLNWVWTPEMPRAPLPAPAWLSCCWPMCPELWACTRSQGSLLLLPIRGETAPQDTENPVKLRTLCCCCPEVGSERSLQAEHL